MPRHVCGGLPCQQLICPVGVFPHLLYTCCERTMSKWDEATLEPHSPRQLVPLRAASQYRVLRQFVLFGLINASATMGDLFSDETKLLGGYKKMRETNVIGSLAQPLTLPNPSTPKLEQHVGLNSLSSLNLIQTRRTCHQHCLRSNVGALHRFCPQIREGSKLGVETAIVRALIECSHSHSGRWRLATTLFMPMPRF